MVIERDSTQPFGAMLRERLATHKSAVVGVTLLLIGEVVAEVLKPWPMKFVIDYLTALEGGEAQTRVGPPGFIDGSIVRFLVFAAAMILGVALFDGLVSFLGTYYRSRLGADIGVALRRDAFARLQRLSLQFHQTQRSGELTNRVVNDTKNLEEFVADSAPTLLRVQATFVVMIVIMFWLDWRLTLVAVVLVPPVVYVVMNWFVKAIKARSRTQRTTEGALVSLTQEALASIHVVKAFSREDFTDNLFDRQVVADRDARLHSVTIEAKFSPTVKLLVQIGVVTVVVFGVLRVASGALSTGDLWVFLSYFRGVKGPLKDLSDGLRQWGRSEIRWERVSELLETKSTDHDPRRRPAPAFAGRVMLNQVHFGYDEATPVLKGANLDVSPGQRVAIVGQTGAGKSTLVGLIASLYEPTAGSVLIDGLDLTNLEPGSVRDQIGFVLQESILFATTLGENIAYGRLDATPDEVVAAAKQARIHDFIISLPDGYNTVVGERGATLSGGQRQRIAIARAILRNARILIFDEPITGLDPATQEEVWAEMQQLMEGRTTLLITHEMRLAERMDVIYHLRDGLLLHEEGRANPRQVRPALPPVTVLAPSNYPVIRPGDAPVTAPEPTDPAHIAAPEPRVGFVRIR